METYNGVIQRIDTTSSNQYEQMMFNKLTIIKDEINEIVTAAQLAKKGIINTNLLDETEIQQILSQVETLPFTNDIEAIEYAEPIMLQKKSLLLYAISLPKTEAKEYNHILVRSTIKDNKRIYFETNELLATQDEQYGITGNCMRIRDMTICKENQLQKLSPDHCISQLLKGTNAGCDYQFYRKPVIEMIDDSTVFLTNFNGSLKHKNQTRILSGSYIIQFNNDSIVINDKRYANEVATHYQVLPPILQANLTEKEIKLDLEYLHDLHLDNIKKIKTFSVINHISVISDVIIYSAVVIIFVLIIRRKRDQEPHQINLTAAQPKFSDLQPIKLNFWSTRRGS